MGQFIKGQVVVVPFPFSDLSNYKRRPALVVTQLTGDDVILCQITSSSNQSDIYSIPLIDSDFESGKLDHASTIRPNRIFTADSNIIIRNVGLLTSQKVKEVVDKIIEIIIA
jgi:mRNA interferase MazF